MEAIVYLGTVLLLVALVVYVRFWLLSFSGQRLSEYEGLGPDFDLKRHLSGSLVCEGVIFGPTGRVSSRFTAKMVGEWAGDEGVLRESFQYDTGAVQFREWRISNGEDGRFVARADDVVGEGIGRAAGPAVRLRYRIVLAEDAGGHTLDVVDWMYLTDSGTIVNRSQFSKFGIKVAELVATIRPEGT